jgi:hypothetical protein
MKDDARITITEDEFRKLPMKEQNVVIFRSITTNANETVGIKRTLRSHVYMIVSVSGITGFTLAMLMQHLLK